MRDAGLAQQLEGIGKGCAELQSELALKKTLWLGATVGRELNYNRPELVAR